MRISPKNKWMDRFHHAFVYCCMGVSVLAIAAIADLGYHYYVNVKPTLKAERLKMERELLKEGSPFVAETEKNTS